MEITLFLLILLIWLTVQNYRLQMRINHIEHYMIPVQSKEIIQLSSLTLDILLEQGLASLPNNLENTSKNRSQALNTVFETTCPVAYQRFISLNVDV